MSRYRRDHDDVAGREGTFAVTTFWLADNLIALGELERARDPVREASGLRQRPRASPASAGGSRKLEVSADHLTLEIVLSNKVVFGTVNANRRHFELGGGHLQKFEARWPRLLSLMITRRLPLTDFARTLERSPGHVKSIVEIPKEGAR